MTDTARALSFGVVAEDYDRYRPPYPPELVADVCAMLPGRRVVEIGAGTGIATRQFAAHDLDLTCVEPDAQMAAVLAARFAGDPRVRVRIATLESWSAARDGDAPRYDGLICGQAWHWTVAETRWRDAAAALVSGGSIALFWNRDGYADPAVSALLGAAYDRNGITDRATSTNDDDDDTMAWPDSEIAASIGFTDRAVRSYRWTRRQSVDDYLARLNTVSAHLILPAEVRRALTEELRESLTRRTGGEIVLAMRTDLAFGRRR